MEEAEQDHEIPGPWHHLLKGGQVFAALVLSTTFSEKYKGRDMVGVVDSDAEAYAALKKAPLDVGRSPAATWDSDSRPVSPATTFGSDQAEAECSPSMTKWFSAKEVTVEETSVAEVKIPAKDVEPKTWRPVLLHRAGNKEAVAFIWLGDFAHRDRTIYICFSPLRFKRQFFKIWCNGLSDQGMSASREWNTMEGAEGATASASDHVLVSRYVKSKLDKMWDPKGKDRLYQKLLQTVKDFPTYRVVFAGISHGATLAQATALKFQIQRKETQVYVVTWNSYRWTDEKGRDAVTKHLGPRFLPFVLSRRKSEKGGTRRYWDSVTGFPIAFSPMPNLVLLDVDSGRFHDHPPQVTGEGSRFGARTMMRMFELHFAKCALSATKKAMLLSFGMQSQDIPVSFESHLEFVHDHAVHAAMRFKRSSMVVTNTARESISGRNFVQRSRTVQLGGMLHTVSEPENGAYAASSSSQSMSQRCHCFAQFSCFSWFFRPDKKQQAKRPFARPLARSGSG